jgi:Secretion system C-terminal sorting domain/Fibronectin type III domain
MKKIILSAGLLLIGQWLLAQDCTAVSPQYTLDFEEVTTPALPDCTLAVNAGLGNNWVTANNPGSGFDNNTLVYTGNTEAANAWFFTKALQLEAGQAYKISYTYGNNSADTTEKFKIWLGSEATAAGMTTTLVTNAAITGAAPTTVTTGPFTAPASGVYYIGFNVYSDAAQGSLYIDNIDVDVWTCALPTNLTVTGISTTAATLSWAAVTTGDPVQFYQISVQAGTADPTPGPTTVTTTAPTFFPLTPATVYTAYVRSFCSGVWSDWTAGVTFTTPLCDTFATVPYTQDFESVTAPAIPECNLATAGENVNNWITTSNPGSGFTSNTLVYNADSATADAWFFTQGVQLEAGQFYKISYKYGNDAETIETLASFLASGPSASAVGTQLGSHTISGGAPVNFMFPNAFSVPASGVYYFAFHATSTADQGSLFLDDITIDYWTCDEPTNITATAITTTGATLSWTAPEGSSPMGYLYWVSTSSETPAPADMIMTPGPTLTLDNLEPSTTYYFFIKSFCGPVIGEWTEPVPFTTQTLTGVAGFSFSNLHVYPNPAQNSISISNTTLIDSAVLYTITGQKVFSQPIANTEATLNVEKLPAGIYLLNLSSEGATKTLKVIKE